MSQRPRHRVAEVIRRFYGRFALRFPALDTPPIRDVLGDLAVCRTAALGGHFEQCDGCGFARVSYNSCRNRHCPSCQGSARSAWLARQEADVLPVSYFHVVFTLPEALRGLALQNKELIYAMLFQTASETLKEVAKDPKHLGAEIGVLAVLHTWGQNLMHHPHLHCVLPAGGIALDGSGWVPCKRSGKGKQFFAPVRVLSKLFRGKFLEELKAARKRGELKYHGSLKHLREESSWQGFMGDLVQKHWVVYCKRPFGGPRPVLKYLARYTHRVAISDQRIQEVTDDSVTFSYKDYRDQGQTKSMTLTGEEFLRRFLLHVLPKRFMRIRSYGFLSNAVRAAKLKLIRGWLAPKAPLSEPAAPGSERDAASEAVTELRQACRCPECKIGTMQRVSEVPAVELASWNIPRRAPPGEP